MEIMSEESYKVEESGREWVEESKWKIMSEESGKKSEQVGDNE